MQIFESLIWKSKLKYKNKEEFISFIGEEYNQNPHLTPKGWNCNVHSNFHQSFHFREIIPDDLIVEIENKSNQFFDDYQSKIKLSGDFFISSMWYNCYTKNQNQEIHNHGEALFSGIYYLKFNKDIHYPTTFYNPNFDIPFLKVKNNPYFCYTLECEEDDIIIFPSNLKHSVDGMIDKKEKELRITISFNIDNTIVNNLKRFDKPSKLIKYE